MKDINFVPVLAAFLVTVILAPVVIPALRRLKMGQTERKEGVASHLKKAGTPTMGGVMFLAAFLVVGLIYAPVHKGIIPVLILTIGFGVIGFIDDFLKVVKKRSDGLFPAQKMALQLVLTACFAAYLIFVEKVPLDLLIPFSGGYMLKLPLFLSVPLLFFVVIGTVNGTNFTDGLDGLASSVTAVVALFFVVIGSVRGSDVSVSAAVMLGGLLGFLLFNVFPAKIFMGDTGSLALGGFVAASAYMLQMPLFLVIVGLIYVAEVLSVIIQVTYFKKTKGKRVFKMAPIHHHFELSGWSETQVVCVFTVITILLCIAAYMGA